MTDTPPRPRASCLGAGCGSLLISTLVGVIAFGVANAIIPDRCEPGDPDCAWVELGRGAPFGALAFLLSLGVAAYAYRSRTTQRR